MSLLSDSGVSQLLFLLALPGPDEHSDSKCVGPSHTSLYYRLLSDSFRKCTDDWKQFEHLLSLLQVRVLSRRRLSLSQLVFLCAQSSCPASRSRLRLLLFSVIS